MSHLSRRALIRGTAAGAAAVAVAGSAAVIRPYKRIACEEAFALPETTASLRKAAGGVPGMHSGPIAGLFMEALLDLGESRIAGMDRAGIDVQLLSLTSPGVQNAPAGEALALARLVNDRLAAVIQAHPNRFAGLAAVAPQRPSETADELERAVRTLGLKGGIINSHTNGEYLDNRKFWPILERATKLDVPIYIHPRDPSPALDAAMIPGFTVGWGYGVETGTHAIRLIASGVFDTFPTLRIVLGHMGETLPMLLDRLDNRYLWETGLLRLPRLKELPSTYFRRNFVVTTSGMNFAGPLRMTIDAIGIDNVMFAADYPLENQDAAVREAEAVPLRPDERAKLFELNARRVFRI